MSKTTKPLTKRDRAWLRRVQKALDACPSERIGFYTIGDAKLMAYDKSRDDEIFDLLDNGRAGDFCQAVDRLDAHLDELNFPSNVHSTAG